MLLPRKTALAIGTLVGLACLAGRAPGFAKWKGLGWETIASTWDLPVESIAPPPVISVAEVRQAGTVAPPAVPEYLLDPEGELDPFFAALLRIEQQKPDAQVRVIHYGDSPTTADMITADVRDLLQERFGNAGHGFVLIGRPWAWYAHRGVDMSSSGWRMDAATTGELRDGLHGLGGVSFRGSAGATARWRLSDRGHAFAEVAYLKQPGGGSFQLESGGEVLGTVDTYSDAREPGFSSVVLPKDAPDVTLRVTSGSVRLHGIQFTRANRGVVYHSLGLNGAYTSMLARMFDNRHWQAQLQHYQPDLVVINYGTNESVYPKWVDSMYAKEAREVIRRIREAVPTTPILVMAPMDRGQRDAEGGIITPDVMPRLINLQASLAKEHGLAFFDTFSAMGGKGTMSRWYRQQPRLVSADYMHPLPGGARIVGSLLYEALLKGYNQFKVRQVQSRHALNTSAPVLNGQPAKPVIETP